MNKNLQNMDLPDAYSLAVLLEKEGFDFYSKISEEADDVQVQNEVKFLRDEEKKHREIFEKLLKQTGSVKEEKKHSLAETWIEEEILKPVKKSLEEKLPSSGSEALKMGRLMETKSIEFYAALRSQEHDSKKRDTIERVMAEEENHLRKIDIILSF
ncbi:MAG: ferritin family protein [Spirochaetota bacterium]